MQLALVARTADCPEEYPKAVCQKRKELIPARKAARKHGDIAYIRYDRLIVYPPSEKPGWDERAKPMGLSLIMWNGVYTQEKIIIQWTLLSEACYFAIQFLVTSVTLVEIGSLPNAAILLLLSRVIFLLVTLLYYYHLGKGRPKKI